MPGLDGLEVCRRVRELPTRLPPYLLLLTVRDSRPDIVAGLRGGADDYMTKPFRTVHTLKGSCGFFGFARLAALSHHGESLLSRLREGIVAVSPSPRPDEREERGARSEGRGQR
jgi:CheY-like chemotaxis protein